MLIPFIPSMCMDSMQRRQAQSPKQSKHQNDKRTLAIKIENFGPISKGKINLKPLTIFVGPNGCGKSHAATLFYTIAQMEQSKYLNHPHLKTILFEENRHNVILKELDRIYRQHVNGASVVKTDILQNRVDPNTELEHMMINSFAEPKTLIQRGKSSATLHISAQTYRNVKIKFHRNNFKVSGLARPKIQVNFTDAVDMVTSPHDDTTEQETRNIYVSPDCSVFDIYNALQILLFGSDSRQKSDVYYFPAERAGLTLAIRTITVSYLYSNMDPNMPRTTINYLIFLMGLPSKESDFADMAKEAEKKIILGEIATEPHKSGHSPPDIYYKSDGYKFPLLLAASSVKDLASFFLYLKYSAKVGDLVILEEPEINLHPAAQIHLARFIVRLINKGLYVVVTTHSPYFLEQISHCVKAGHVDNDDVNSVLPKEERILPDDVAPYKFVRHGSAYDILDMPVSAEGIPQEEFLAVDEALYDELLKLRRLEHE